MAESKHPADWTVLESAAGASALRGTVDDHLIRAVLEVRERMAKREEESADHESRIGEVESEARIRRRFVLALEKRVEALEAILADIDAAVPKTPSVVEYLTKLRAAYERPTATVELTADPAPRASGVRFPRWDDRGPWTIDPAFLEAVFLAARAHTDTKLDWTTIEAILLAAEGLLEREAETEETDASDRDIDGAFLALAGLLGKPVEGPGERYGILRDAFDEIRRLRAAPAPRAEEPDDNDKEPAVTTMSALSDADPRMVAWEAYKQTPEYANTKGWATYPEHTEGSLWAAWLRGWEDRAAASDTPAPAVQPEPVAWGIEVANFAGAVAPTVVAAYLDKDKAYDEGLVRFHRSHRPRVVPLYLAPPPPAPMVASEEMVERLESALLDFWRHAAQ